MVLVVTDDHLVEQAIQMQFSTGRCIAAFGILPEPTYRIQEFTNWWNVAEFGLQGPYQ